MRPSTLLPKFIGTGFEERVRRRSRSTKGRIEVGHDSTSYGAVGTARSGCKHAGARDVTRELVYRRVNASHHTNLQSLDSAHWLAKEALFIH
ncbi:hypothetical protein DPMN_070715 [Dreissena polymorpha]|uniref:Uncharacterized protein n=1 Tax=Dreissena polymorpha TaxID=45954 RepID=A0A9D4BX90_DREPO|nr:hypothetical protein DPMN_070715 [Dreissena polymorpha]